jgi:hypothetical protein
MDSELLLNTIIYCIYKIFNSLRNKFNEKSPHFEGLIKKQTFEILN